MGMYTELIFGASLVKSRMSAQDIEAIQYLFGETENKPVNLPSHPFFQCPRWDFITRCSSYYFAVRSIHRSVQFDKISETYNCSSRANLKNYDNEIALFLDWVKPFIEQGSGSRNFYAVVCYEEQDEPTIYYLNEP